MSGGFGDPTLEGYLEVVLEGFLEEALLPRPSLRNDGSGSSDSRDFGSSRGFFSSFFDGEAVLLTQCALSRGPVHFGIL